MKFLFSILLIPAFAMANLNNDETHRPRCFDYQDSKAVFVDFDEALYEITYDIKAKQATVNATMKFRVLEEGHPLFDLVNDPSTVKLNGEVVSVSEVKTPSNETTLRVLSKKLVPGSYELNISVALDSLVQFTDTGVKSAFWVSDLTDRSYLERYIPVNLEFDRIKKTFDVKFIGLETKQHVFANGNVKWLSPTRVKIEYPEYFTVNSVYFHTTPVDSVQLVEFSFKSKDGRDLPVQIYSNKGVSFNPNTWRTKVVNVLNELEGDYGPFLHSSVTIYNADLSQWGLGGMEYAGATVTDIYSVSHELFHSYFARGVTPANGNAGWLDESLASWRDNKYNRLTTLTGSSKMAAHPYYTRKTDTDAYTFGARFMAYLDGKFASKGGLKPFMNKLLEKKVFTPIFTEEFIEEMESFYDEKVSDIFKMYVYDQSKTTSPQKMKDSHPVHRKMGMKELKQIL